MMLTVLGRRARGAIPHPIMGRAIDLERNVYSGRQTRCVVLGKDRLAPLNRSHRSCRNPRLCSELRLGEAHQDAEIAWESFIFGYMDQVADRHSQGLSRSCKQVNLGSRMSSLPVVDLSLIHI